MTNNSVRPIVLVALDGSPAAAAALPIARTLATQLDASLKVLHVALPPAESAIPDMHVDDVELQLELGEAASRIVENAADPHVAVVVLTTHGREVESDGRLGHVARAVVASTQQPVLLVRPESVKAWAAGDGAPLRHLLLPLDGTPTTAFLLRPAMQLCALLHATIDVLYVAGAPTTEPGSIRTPEYLDQPQYEWSQWADEIIDRLVCYCAASPPEVEARAFLATGDAGEEIVRFAKEHHSDAIIAARRSRLEPGRAATLRFLLSESPCPILLVGGA